MNLSALRVAIEPPPREAVVAATRIILRRTGGRPLCFKGRLVHAAEADDGTGQNLIRLALYRCCNGFAVSLSHEPVCAGTPALPWHRAEFCPTLEQALAVFETAQPASDDGGAAPCGPSRGDPDARGEVGGTRAGFAGTRFARRWQLFAATLPAECSAVL